jgi:hypothetical protein
MEQNNPFDRDELYEAWGKMVDFHPPSLENLEKLVHKRRQYSDYILGDN